MNRGALPVVALLVTLALAGCTDSGTEETDPDIDTGTGSDGPVDEGLTADSVVEAPQWQVGEWWHREVEFDDGDTGAYYTTVIDGAGADWTLAASNEEGATWEATWGMPDLGTVGRDHLTSEAYSGTWDLYDFPLQDGKTWDATLTTVYGRERPLTMTAAFDPAVTWVGEPEAGFKITGTNADGVVELETDYLPSLGWFGELLFYDLLTATEGDVELRLTTRDHGVDTDQESSYVLAEATQVIDYPSLCFAPVNQDGSVNDACGTAGVSEPFEVAEGTDRFYGAAFVGALAGNSMVNVVLPPGSERTDYLVQATSPTMDSFEQEFLVMDLEDPPAGSWSYSWSGEGMVAVAYTELWTITFTPGVLGAPGDS